MKRCVLFTAGGMGPLNFIQPLLLPDDYIICADGGLGFARSLGITPDLVVGDFDSSPVPEEGLFEVLRVKPEKDETDTCLAIDCGLRRGCGDFLILGGLRGRLDHTVANFSALMHIYRQGATGYIRDADNEVHLLMGGETTIPRRDGWYVSLFPFIGETEGVTLRGLKYPLENARLACDWPLGVSNEFAADEAVISIKNGPLLIILSKK